MFNDYNIKKIQATIPVRSVIEIDNASLQVLIPNYDHKFNVHCSILFQSGNIIFPSCIRLFCNYLPLVFPVYDSLFSHSVL